MTRTIIYLLRPILACVIFLVSHGARADNFRTCQIRGSAPVLVRIFLLPNGKLGAWSDRFYNGSYFLAQNGSSLIYSGQLESSPMNQPNLLSDATFEMTIQSAYIPMTQAKGSISLSSRFGTFTYSVVCDDHSESLPSEDPCKRNPRCH